MFLIAGLILFLLMLRLTLRSDFLLNQVRLTAEKQVSGSMNGALSIGSLRGDLLKGLQVSDIRLVDANSEPVITLDSLHIYYQIWPALRGIYKINEISLFGPAVFADQPTEDRWNILELFEISDTQQDEEQSVSLIVKNLEIHNGQIRVISPWLLPDNEISLTNIHLGAAITLAPDKIQAGLHRLDFNILEGRLPEAVQVDLAGHANQSRITLDRLVINTGRTLLETAATNTTDGSEVTLNTLLNPLSWRDLIAYTEEPLLLQDVYLELGTRGSLDELTVNLALRAQGMDEVALEIRGGIPAVTGSGSNQAAGNTNTTAHVPGSQPTATREQNPNDTLTPAQSTASNTTLADSQDAAIMPFSPVLTSIRLQSGGLNLPQLTGNAALPELQSLKLSLQGTLPVFTPEAADFEGLFTVQGLRADDFHIALDQLQASFTLSEGIFESTIKANHQQEEISSQITLNDFLGQSPVWKFTIQGNSIQPANWAPLPEGTPEAVFTFRATAEGTGFEPEEQPWTANLTITDAKIDEQIINTAAINLEIDAKYLRVMTSITPGQGEIRLNAAFDNWKDDLAGFHFYAETDHFDLRQIQGFESFPTSISLRMLGEGRGFDPSTMQLNATLEMTESVVNGADIDRLQANLHLSDGILQLRDTFLESTLARGRLDVRQDIDDIMNPDNRIDFNLRLGDINPLAPLAGLYLLEATGEIKGTLSPGNRQIPTIDALVELSNLKMDSILVSSVTGRMEVLLQQTTTVATDLRIASIRVADTHIEDLWLRAEGTLADTTGNARYRADITLDNSGLMKISTQGTVMGMLPAEAPPGPFQIETTVLNLQDNGLHYGLREPFTIHYANELFRLEPLILIGDSGVELLFEAEQYSAAAYRGRFLASDVHLGTLQRLVLGDAMFEGLMKGSVYFDVDTVGDVLEITAEIEASDLDADGFKVEDVQLELKLKEHRLSFIAHSTRNGETWIQAAMVLPFRPGDTSAFEPEFFQQHVSGNFTLLPIDLAEETALTKLLGLEDVGGLVSFDAHLSGTAGEPGFDTDFRLDQGRFSGVSIDSMHLKAAYHHQEKAIRLDSRLVSLGQVVATLQGSVPFEFDAPSLGFTQPESEQSISLILNTNRLNVAALNQFADPALVRNIAGQLDADLQISGNFTQPEVTGSLSFSRGNLFLTEQNVTFRDIQTALTFAADRIRVDRFSMQSTGNLTASGDILLQGFVPQSVDIGVQARNFRVYNTRDIQALITMDTKLAGGIRNPRLTGTFELDRGHLYLDNFGERTVEEVILEDEKPSMFDGLQFWQDLATEVQFSTRRNFWLRNRTRPEIQLELNGVLELIKYPGEDIQVFGTFGASEGYVNQLGRRFELEEADVTFSGPPDNPAFNVRTIYALRQPDDIRIWYVIEGTATEPRFRWESDPEMKLQDIISYTLFGRPFHSLMAWQQTTTIRSDGGVTAAALDILLDRVEQLATQALGIDVLQIDNTRTGGQSGTTIKAGKFITDRAFVAILQELGATVSSQVMLEYELRRNLDLIITGSDNNRTGIDIQWKRDY